MNRNQAQNYGNCPVCNGSGWELYKAAVQDYPMEEVDFARECRKCKGHRRNEDRTGTPPEYYSADIHKFDFNSYSVDMSRMKDLVMNMLNNFGYWQEKSKGLYLWSKTPGSGKTFLSCSLAKSVMIKHDLQMRFVTAPDYLAAVGEGYKVQRGDQDPSEVYRRCRLLVLDDIGAQADKDWYRQEMFRLVDKRMNSGLVTIYTSNMPVEELPVDDRTKDRIIRSSVVLQMPEESIRRKAARNEQEEFLKRI